MKKEIKKLQRVREYFRSNLNNSEIKDKSKLLEAKRRIESVSHNIQIKGGPFLSPQYLDI